jgi:hypothetical protein
VTMLLTNLVVTFRRSFNFNQVAYIILMSSFNLTLPIYHVAILRFLVKGEDSVFSSRRKSTSVGKVVPVSAQQDAAGSVCPSSGNFYTES